jgi:hypothetical protein
MVVLHDFTPCVDDELEVKRGQIVNILYRENDWVYIIGQDTKQEGFIPYSYCAPYNSQLADLAIKKKLPRNAMPLDQNQLSDYSEMEMNHHPANEITLQNNLKHSQGSLNYCEPGNEINFSREFHFFTVDVKSRFLLCLQITCHSSKIRAEDISYFTHSLHAMRTTSLWSVGSL